MPIDRTDEAISASHHRAPLELFASLAGSITPSQSRIILPKGERLPCLLDENIQPMFITKPACNKGQLIVEIRQVR